MIPMTPKQKSLAKALVSHFVNNFDDSVIAHQTGPREAHRLSALEFLKVAIASEGTYYMSRYGQDCGEIYVRYGPYRKLNLINFEVKKSLQDTDIEEEHLKPYLLEALATITKRLVTISAIKAA